MRQSQLNPAARRPRRCSPISGGTWGRVLGTGLVLLGLLGGGAVRGSEPAATAEREPALRKIDWQQDVEARKRITYYRKRLPDELQKQNNFAWARADIPGLRKKEYYAHSRIQSLEGLSSRAAKRISGISPKPAAETSRFETLFVDYAGNIGGRNAIPRWFDTEYKIIEDIASRLPDSTVSGKILLFTELEPCLSCWGVMKQFMAAYPHIEIEVLYNWP